MTGMDQVVPRASCRVDGDLDRARAVLRRDARGDALGRASTVTMNTVPSCVSLRSVHLPQVELVAASSVRQRQIEAAPVHGHKVIASGVANSAAKVMSPSFSRSSSSTRTTKRPFRISSIASSTDANGDVSPHGDRLGAHAVEL